MAIFKFLAPGRRHPFSGTVLPEPGVWFGEELDGPDGVRGYVVTQLAHWLDAELWEIEIGGDVTELPFSLAAPQARLVRRIDGWTDLVAIELVETWVWRARDELAGRLVAAGHDAAAHALQHAATVTDLARTTAHLALDGHWTDPVDALQDAAEDARDESAATALLTATVAIAGWDDAGQAAERSAQSAWIALRLALTS